MRRFLLAAVAVLCFSIPTFGANTARAQLGVVIPSARLTNVPLSDAIDFISSVTGANINVHWKELADANVSKDSLVNLSLHGVRGGRLLSMALNEAAGGSGVLTWYIDDNVVEVTTSKIEDSKMITIVYYVDDILSANAPFNSTIQSNIQFSNTNTGSGGGSGGGGYGGGGGGNSGGLFGGSSGQQGGQNQTQSNTQLAQGLIKLIETVIRPDVWRDNNPSGTASMDYYNGNLIVTAPRSVQEMIGGPVN